MQVFRVQYSQRSKSNVKTLIPSMSLMLNRMSLKATVHGDDWNSTQINCIGFSVQRAEFRIPKTPESRINTVTDTTDTTHDRKKNRQRQCSGRCDQKRSKMRIVSLNFCDCLITDAHKALLHWIPITFSATLNDGKQFYGGLTILCAEWGNQNFGNICIFFFILYRRFHLSHSLASPPHFHSRGNYVIRLEAKT